MEDVGVAIASGLDGGSSSAGASSVGDSSAESVVAADAPFTGTCAFVAGEVGVCDNGCDRIASGEIKYMHLEGLVLVAKAGVCCGKEAYK